MIERRQLPVASPITTSGLLRAAGAYVTGGSAHDTVRDALAARYGASAVVLMDSGTSALVAALRMAVPKQDTVALPAYACVDLIAAARYAGVRVRLYDVTPETLSPDMDSVRRALQSGVGAVIVAHLYGYPADVVSVRAAAANYGAVVIEDAAQQAGATIHGERAGGFGPLTVLSFGRGKGTTAGNGGALLAFDDRWRRCVDATASRIPRPGRGTRDIVGASASWMLGRPSVYSIPSSIPSLHLGETVYHDAHEPAPLSSAAAALLRTSLVTADAHTAIRQRHAAELVRAASTSPRVRACSVIPGGMPGYLRVAVLANDGVEPNPSLGIVRGYPRPLSEQPELAPILERTSDTFPGASELAARLLTLPTHHMVTAADQSALVTWLHAT